MDRNAIPVPADGAEWWTVQIQRAATGPLNDVWIKPGDQLSGYFSLVPG